METTFEAVIIADGTFPIHPIPLGILQQTPHVIACDGAIRHIPDAEAVVGDGDSVPAIYRHRLVKVDEQEDNDLTKATRHCLRQGWHKIAYLGCTGMREDHTLGNISLLMRYYRHFAVNGAMFTDHGFFVPARGTTTFHAYAGQQVSIFNFGSYRLRSQGLKWNSYPYSEWWQGTLNEALYDQFTLEADGYFMVYQTYAL
jgi:thiamine pyrophosphokinase